MLSTKYKPTKLSDYVCSRGNSDLFQTYLDTGEIPHMLLSGPPGIGKTSLAILLANSLEDSPCLYINASEENGIDVIRSRVKDFTEIRSDGKKFVILDESDGLSNAAQAALRNLIESTLDTVFIFTCNFPDKIIEPIKSRCPMIDLTFTQAAVTKRLVSILNAEGVECDKNTVVNLHSLVGKVFPDIRKAINLMQRGIVDNKFDITRAVPESMENFAAKWMHLATQPTGQTILQKANDMREFGIINSGEFGSDWVTLSGQLFFSAMNKKTMTEQQVLDLNEWIYRIHTAIDKEIIFFGFTVKLLQTIK